MNFLDENGNTILENSIVIADSVGNDSYIINATVFPDSIVNVYYYNDITNLNCLQRLTFDGSLFFNNGEICPFDSYTTRGFMDADSSGIIIAYENFTQKLDFEGNKLWGENGIQFSTSTHIYNKYITDSKGGFINMWNEPVN